MVQHIDNHLDHKDLLELFEMNSIMILKRSEMERSMYPNFYYETWPRIPQYLAGILLGWFIYNRTKMNQSQRPVSLHWVYIF